MLIKNLFSRNTCFSPDDIAGGGSGDAVADTTVVTGTDQMPVGGGNQDGQTTEEKAPDYKALYEKRGKENARLVNTIQHFQKRSETNTEQPNKSKDSGSIEENLRTHGLTADEDGFVDHKGMRVSAEFALNDIARDQKVSGMESALQAQRDAETQTEHNTALNEVFTGFQELCKGLADAVLPGLEGEAQAKMSRSLEREARVIFADLRAEHGDTGITVDIMREAAVELAEDRRQTAMSIISKQFSKNKQYAENHPTKPDGQPGHSVPGDHFSLSKDDRLKASAAAVRQVESSRQSR